MPLMCTICGLWSPCVGGDRLDICDSCFTANFAGAQPPLEWPTAREALEASVSPGLTPRQQDAMRQMHARAKAEALRRLAGEED